MHSPSPAMWRSLIPVRARIHSLDVCRRGFRASSSFVTVLSGRQAQIVLPAPGVVEHDLEITGGSLRGTVIDENTGASIRGKPFGRLLDGICIRVPSGIADRGFVQVRLSGLDGLEQNRVYLSLGREADPYEYSRGLSISPGGDCLWKSNSPFEAGTWTADVDVCGLGRAEKSFLIVAGKTTEVDFFPSDFTTLRADFTVEGTVCWTGGDPLRGAQVILRGLRLLGPDRKRLLKATTDGEGRFSLQKAVAGRWEVEAALPGGERKICPSLEISGDGPSRVPLEIVLPRGAVSGTLVNGRTGKPLDAGSSPWRALLLSAEKKYDADYWTASLAGKEGWLVRIDGAGSGARLGLAGVAAGTYVLRIQAEDYFDYVSGPIVVGEGEKVELGAIPLEPSGIVIVDAVDPRGAAVKYLWVDFPDVEPSPRERVLCEGRMKFWQVPFGEHKIDVGAGSFKDLVTTVTVRPGVVERKRVVLTPSTKDP